MPHVHPYNIGWAYGECHFEGVVSSYTASFASPMHRHVFCYYQKRYYCCIM